MKNRDEIIKILQVVRNTTSDIEKQADRICNLFDVSKCLTCEWCNELATCRNEQGEISCKEHYVC